METSLWKTGIFRRWAADGLLCYCTISRGQVQHLFVESITGPPGGTQSKVVVCGKQSSFPHFPQGFQHFQREKPLYGVVINRLYSSFRNIRPQKPGVFNILPGVFNFWRKTPCKGCAKLGKTVENLPGGGFRPVFPCRLFLTNGPGPWYGIRCIRE